MNIVISIKRVFALAYLCLLISIHAKPNDNSQAIQEEIRRRIENIEIYNQSDHTEHIYAVKSVQVVYIDNDFEKLWNKGREIEEFISEIKNAEEEGLNPKDYHLTRLEELQQTDKLTIPAMAELDILLTDAFLLFASHLLSGKVDPVLIDADWHVSRREGDPVQLFNQTIRSNNYNSTIDDLIPTNKRYLQLKKALKDYREIERNGGWEVISFGSNIAPGQSDERIPKIRKRLVLTGDIRETDEHENELEYSKKLNEAILTFQRRHGFKGDGIIDEPTIRAMNVPIEERIKQIEINLERWRWMPQEFSDYYVLVNIANYDLQIVKEGNTEQSYKVVAGKPARKTPVFSSKISYLVLNPTWTIPPTILRNDVIPEIRKSVDYLSRKNIKVLNVAGKQLNPDSIDWNSNAIFSYMYRQDPGPNNALGAVKFMFPNSFNVYIHDTPSKELFNKSDRAFSSGCIRVENPLDLAVKLLDDPQKWNREKINRVIESNIIQTVSLKAQPDVYLLYWTSWISNGAIQFRKDIYERDEKLYRALKDTP